MISHSHGFYSWIFMQNFIYLVLKFLYVQYMHIFPIILMKCLGEPALNYTVCISLFTVHWYGKYLGVYITKKQYKFQPNWPDRCWDRAVFVLASVLFRKWKKVLLPAASAGTNKKIMFPLAARHAQAYYRWRSMHTTVRISVSAVCIRLYFYRYYTEPDTSTV
jgi:hypothetical protein